MIPLRALKAHPHYAGLFEHVPRLLWPILWWQLNAMIFWMRDQNITGVCFQTSWWGFITIRFAAQAEAADLYKPIRRVFRELSDPSWGTRVPANLASDDPSIWHTLILPRLRGRWPEGPEGALTPIPNTS